MKDKKVFYLILILTISLQNCASFDRKTLNTKVNLLDLNGKYEAMPLVFDSISKSYISKRSDYRDFFRLIDQKKEKKSVKLNIFNNYHFELNIINPKKTRITYLENDKIIQDRIVKTKFRKDGYLYLKNKKLNFTGVPYLFGGFDFTKTRLTLDKNKNLVLEIATFSSGAGLIIMFLNFENRTHGEKFKRVK